METINIEQAVSVAVAAVCVVGALYCTYTLFMFCFQFAEWLCEKTVNLTKFFVQQTVKSIKFVFDVLTAPFRLVYNFLIGILTMPMQVTAQSKNLERELQLLRDEQQKLLKQKKDENLRLEVLQKSINTQKEEQQKKNTQFLVYLNRIVDKLSPTITEMNTPPVAETVNTPIGYHQETETPRAPIKVKPEPRWGGETLAFYHEDD